MTTEAWLNGWHRSGSTVLMGTGVHCIGCGKSHGTACAAFSLDYVPPEKDPDWPFPESDCPVCVDSEAYRFDAWPPRAVELYIKLRRSEAELVKLRGPG